MANNPPSNVKTPAADPVHVLLIDDEADTLLPILAQDLESMGFEFRKQSSAVHALSSVESVKPDVVLLDLHFPGDDLRRDGRTTGGDLLTKIRPKFPSLPVIIFTARLDDHDIPLEAFEERPHGYFAKRILENDPASWPTALAQAMRDAIDTARFEQEVQDGDLGFLVGQTQAMREVAARIRTAASNRLPVLIYGETGTGKQLAAEAIHRLSGRRGRFEQLNCAGVDENTLEDLLFGHERGAFTSAVGAREGFFELADGGTLFLDEIQRMPMALQDKLMLVLEQGKVRRMGANAERVVDVRLVAATNHNLADLVVEEVLREDLAYRLCAGLLLSLPPLRQRMADLPALFEHFIAKTSGGRVLPTLRPETRDKLCVHHWPGNIRELEATLARAVALTRSNVLLPEDIEFAVLAGSRNTAAGTSPSATLATPPATTNLVSQLCDRLESLPLEERYAFLLGQEKGLRAEVLIEFIRRLRRTSPCKVDHKALAVELHPCDGGVSDFDKIRQFVSSCNVKLTSLEFNQ